MSLVCNLPTISAKTYGYTPIDTSLPNEDDKCVVATLIDSESFMEANDVTVVDAKLASYTSNIDNIPECTDDKQTNLLFEVDLNSLEEYNYAKSWIGIAISVASCPAAVFLFFTSFEFMVKYWVLLVYVIALSLIPRIPCQSLIRFIRQKTKQTPLTASATFLTHKGIKHVQSKDPDASTPTGGEVFLPFEDVEDICIGTSENFFGFAVTLVAIETKERMTKYAVSGCPSSSSAFWRNTPILSKKHVTVLFGLSDPSSFQRIVRERKEALV